MAVPRDPIFGEWFQRFLPYFFFGGGGLKIEKCLLSSRPSLSSSGSPVVRTYNKSFCMSNAVQTYSQTGDRFEARRGGVIRIWDIQV